MQHDRGSPQPGERQRASGDGLRERARLRRRRALIDHLDGEARAPAPAGAADTAFDSDLPRGRHGRGRFRRPGRRRGRLRVRPRRAWPRSGREGSLPSPSPDMAVSAITISAIPTAIAAPPIRYVFRLDMKSSSDPESAESRVASAENTRAPPAPCGLPFPSAIAAVGVFRVPPGAILRPPRSARGLFSSTPAPPALLRYGTRRSSNRGNPRLRGVQAPQLPDQQEPA